MKCLIAFLLLTGFTGATVIEVVPVHQPVSLHGSDVDDEVDLDSGESLQAAVMSVPMALSGGFPEALVQAVMMPLKLSSNNENYEVREVNLCQLCGIKLHSECVDTDDLHIEIDVANLHLPTEIDLTPRQVVKLVAAAVRKTLVDYNKVQKNDIEVLLRVVGTNENNSTLQDLGAKYVVAGAEE